MSKLRLVSFDLCPYVQRSAIALEEKRVPYDIEFIELSDKPEWFVRISPRGKVPLLQVGDAVLFESAAILEYLDETHAPRLHPEAALDRAIDRAWFATADALTMLAYKLMIADDRAALVEHAEGAKRELARFEGKLVGPLWRGETLCMVDAVSFPALQRLGWLSELHPELELFVAVPKVRAWSEALAVRPAVVRSALPDLRERFVQSLAKYGAVHADVATPSGDR